MTTMGIDPRQGLRPNLDLLSAYKLYEKDYPLFKPDISATLAMNSPLYKRIQDSLTDQSQLKAEHDADQARMRNAAVTANVPLEPLREMMTTLIRETRPPEPATQAASSSLNAAHMQVDSAQGDRLLAEQQAIANDQRLLEQGRAIAASVSQSLGQTFLTPIQTLMQQLAGVQTSMQSATAAQAPVQHVHHQPVTQHFHTDNRQVALVDARQALQQAVDGRQVNIVDASQNTMVDASQNTFVDARQVNQMMQVDQEVNVMPINVTVAMTAFTINHRTEILQFMQDNSVTYDVAANILFNIYYGDGTGVPGGGGGGPGPGPGGPGGPPPKAITQGQLALTNPGPPPGVNPAPKSKAKTAALPPAAPKPKGPPAAKYGPATGSVSTTTAIAPYAKPKGAGKGGAKAKGSAKAKATVSSYEL